MELLASAYSGLPPQPACSGPLLVHADGAFECHGTDCPGGMAMLHGEDALGPCYTRVDLTTRHACPRCAGHSSAAAVLEFTCTGTEIEHDNGTVECSLGADCAGDAALHMSSHSCRMFGHCPRNCEPAGPDDEQS